MAKAKVKDLVKEVKTVYPEYTNELIKEYVAMMQGQNYSEVEIAEFKAALSK